MTIVRLPNGQFAVMGTRGLPLCICDTRWEAVHQMHTLKLDEGR